jgi:3alpha(or 20beta)-hydroxysteroid dehydrogenase
MTSAPATRVRRAALVTGATGAIGAKIAARLSAEFDHIVVTDLDLGESSALASQLGPDHVGLAIDVTREESWLEAIDEVRRRFGRLDALVNNAVFSTPGSVVDEEMGNWSRVVAVGQTGTWLGMKHAGPLIAGTGGGSIVNMCSILSTVGVRHSFAYQAAKGAVRSMTKSAAIFWADQGVRVNSLHPGFIETPRMIDRMGNPDFRQSVLQNIPAGRLGTAEEVAAAVAFLTSDDAAFMTGSEMYVDGGTTAW